MIDTIFGDAPLNDTRQVNRAFLGSYQIIVNRSLFPKNKPHAVLSLTVNRPSTWLPAPFVKQFILVLKNKLVIIIIDT